MKKLLALISALTLALALAACGAAEPTENGSGNQSDGVANPFVECSSLDEAAETAGFSLSAPDDIDGYEQYAIRTMAEGEDAPLIEVVYRSGDNADSEIRIRKAASENDISGDYADYDETEYLTLDGAQITVKGNGGTVSLATWTQGEYAYAITASNPAGLPLETMEDLIAAVS